VTPTTRKSIGSLRVGRNGLNPIRETLTGTRYRL
jgi:hypothetical protein